MREVKLLGEDLGIVKMMEKVLNKEDFSKNIQKASENSREGLIKVKAMYPRIQKYAEEIIEIKKQVANDLESYIEKAMSAVEKRRGKPYYARNGEEARKIIGEILSNDKIIVFSKSMATEEVGLRSYLEKIGKEVYETDLGEFLVQLEDGKPMHTIAPAIHLSRKQAKKLVSKKLGIRLRGDAPEEIAMAVRVFLRKKIVNADAGITGANSFSVDTGSIVLVENEGNIRLVSGFPEKHIALIPVDKILPTLDHAIKQALLQSFYAGIYPTSYINIISGPSSTADIEHRKVFGAQGPRELHVVFLDNGRTEAAGHDIFSSQLLCIRCGRCQFECPVWNQLGNHWGGKTYGGPMGIVWSYIVGEKEVSKLSSLLCLNCKRCDYACPMKIPLSDILIHLKSLYY